MDVAIRDTLGTWAGAARDYLRRGEVVSVVPHAGITVGDDRSARWRFTDCAGDPLAESAWVRAAVAGLAPTVTVQLRDGDTVLSQGRLDVRRTVAGTVSVALMAAGPLIEMAAVGADAPEQARDRQPATAPGRAMTQVRGHGQFGGRLSRATVTYRQWGVARLPGGSAERLAAGKGLTEPVVWQSPAPNYFWADPLVVTHDGRTWLFVEELDRGTGRGHITALVADGPGLRVHGKVWATRHHVSYPQVQNVDGRWIATVETCERRNVMLTFDRLGDPWREAEDLPALPPHAADPLVQFESGAPARVICTDAATCPDGAYTEHVREDGRWRRSSRATYVDVTTARGGGTLDAGLGLRTVQDCAKSYGRALALVPATGWRGSLYGSPLAVLDGSGVTSTGWQPVGVHTLTWDADGSSVWIDGWRRRGSPLGGYKRWVERRHLAECDGS